MSNLPLEASMMKRIGELKAELDRIKLKSECQAEGINAFDKKLREAEAENARLKAECQARQAENSVLAVECDSLKAEVERLTSDLQMEKENEDRLVREWQKANNEVYGLKTQVAALIDDQTRLKAEAERMKQQVDYWRIESDCNHGRWLRCLEDLEHLRASSFVTAVPSEQYERVIKAGDVMAIMLQYDEVSKEWDAAKKGGQP